MGDKTGISWTDATWNPIRGCSRVSEGCRHCYAERVAARFCGPGQPYEGLARMRATLPGIGKSAVSEPRWTGEVRLVPEHLADPLRWKRPRRIFVNSMSDLFHEKLTNEQIAAVFGVMAAAPQHTFQVLTKRAKRMREWFAWSHFAGQSTCEEAVADHAHMHGVTWDARGSEAHRYSSAPVDLASRRPWRWPLPNVWLGVSVENQAAADERIPELLRTPAAVRFLSCEPLLGAVRLHEWLGREHGLKAIGAPPGLLWIIAGCESGPGARPCDVSWLRSLRDQCASAGVPFFLKQARGLCGPGNWLPRNEIGAQHGVVTAMPGGTSKIKAGGVIELPYLDGVQHAAFPEQP